MAYCDVHDIGTFANCLLAERAGVFEKLGRWDECVSMTHSMLEELSVSPANRISRCATRRKCWRVEAKTDIGRIWTRRCT